MYFLPMEIHTNLTNSIRCYQHPVGCSLNQKHKCYMLTSPLWNKIHFCNTKVQKKGHDRKKNGKLVKKESKYMCASQSQSSRNLSVLSDMTRKILLRTDTRLVYCNRILMRTDIFFTRTSKSISNIVNPAIRRHLSMPN